MSARMRGSVGCQPGTHPTYISRHEKSVVISPLLFNCVIPLCTYSCTTKLSRFNNSFSFQLGSGAEATNLCSRMWFVIRQYKKRGFQKTEIGVSDVL